MLTAPDLLRAVRGRRLCFELAQGGPTGDDVRRAMFDEVDRVHRASGDYARGSVAMVMTTSDDAAAGPASRGPRSAPTLVEALSAVDPQPPSAAALLAALSDTVGSAMGWQPPHAEDVVLAGAEVRATLLPVAEALVRAPGAAWWSSPLDPGAQIDTRFVDTSVNTSRGGRASAEDPGGAPASVA